jgi:hypothetical protein
MAKASYADFRMQWQGADAHALADYFDELTDKLQRKIARKMVRAGGTVVAKYMREEIKSLDMPYSRARNRKSRAKAKAKNQKPLFKTIGQKPYKVPLKGIIGTRVGPRHPEGAHGIIVDVGGNHPWGTNQSTQVYGKGAQESAGKSGMGAGPKTKASTGGRAWCFESPKHSAGKQVVGPSI